MSGLRAAPARASVSPEDLKFVFVVVYRGWDPTRVFAPEFDNPNVAMEADAQIAEIGGLRYVDHAARPSVRAFFEAHHARSLIVNGVGVPSLSHSECLRIVMTGDGLPSGTDWASLIAGPLAGTYGLPHVVILGPQFPGRYSSAVTRLGTSGHVEGILNGDVLGHSDTPLGRPSKAMEAVLQGHAETRAFARQARDTSELERRLAAAYASSTGRVSTLQALGDTVRWGTDESLEAQSDLAVDLLGLGLTRCVTLGYEDLSWDSHADNDVKQSANFETLFAGLVYLMEQLSRTPGSAAPLLVDETVVVVLSEMGRTPHLNGGAGKDHWPHTSALLVGPGLTGGRVVGGYSELYNGEPLDFATGDPSASGSAPHAGNLGATLLTLAGVDAAAAFDRDPILGLLT